MKPQPGIRWTSNSTYVDIDTGEIIKKDKVKNTENYIIIKTTKNVTINHIGTRGHIEYTIECRRNPQGTLFN